MMRTGCFFLTTILASFIFANSATAQLRVEDRLRIGDISIRYDSNRWMLSSERTTKKARLDCRELRCGIEVRIKVEDKANVCRAETVDNFLLKRARETTVENFSLYGPQSQKVLQSGKMTWHMAKAYSGCHVPTEFVFACGEYRGRTYSMWLSPKGCTISRTSGSPEEIMTRLLSGISAK
jgi:hypothetical protein